MVVYLAVVGTTIVATVNVIVVFVVVFVKATYFGIYLWLYPFHFRHRGGR